MIDPVNTLTLEQIKEELLTREFVNIHCVAPERAFFGP